MMLLITVYTMIFGQQTTPLLTLNVWRSPRSRGYKSWPTCCRCRGQKKDWEDCRRASVVGRCFGKGFSEVWLEGMMKDGKRLDPRKLYMINIRNGSQKYAWKQNLEGCLIFAKVCFLQLTNAQIRHDLRMKQRMQKFDPGARYDGKVCIVQHGFFTKQFWDCRQDVLSGGRFQEKNTFLNDDDDDDDDDEENCCIQIFDFLQILEL